MENDFLLVINSKLSKIVSHIDNKTDELYNWYSEVYSMHHKTISESEELTTAISELPILCNKFKQDTAELEKNVHEKEERVKKYIEELNKLSKEYEELNAQIDKMKLECECLKKKTTVSSVDQKILDTASTKLDLFKQLTNIHWDYTISLKANHCSGYISNKPKKYLKAFDVKKNSAMCEKLWKEIELGSGEDWSDIVSMTDTRFLRK